MLSKSRGKDRTSCLPEGLSASSHHCSSAADRSHTTCLHDCAASLNAPSLAGDRERSRRSFESCSTQSQVQGSGFLVPGSGFRGLGFPVGTSGRSYRGARARRRRWRRSPSALERWHYESQDQLPCCIRMPHPTQGKARELGAPAALECTLSASPATPPAPLALWLVITGTHIEMVVLTHVSNYRAEFARSPLIPDLKAQDPQVSQRA